MDYTIGQLARLSGITVRTLRYYEKQGLLVAPSRTAGNYRRYSEGDVIALHRILACSQMGVGLKDIGRYLGPNGPPLRELLVEQAAKTRSDIAQRQSLLSKLERLVELSSTQDPSTLSSELLDLLNMMQSLHQHYTPEEFKELVAIREALAPEDQPAIRNTVRKLLEGFAAALAQGEEPNSAEVKALARQWAAVGSLAPVSPEVAQKTRSLIDTNEQVQRATGIGAGLRRYIDLALAAAKGSP